MLQTIRVENLILDLPGRRLFDNISFALSLGDTVAMMGPSGSGKTSLLNCLSGVTRPTSGRIWLNGVELTSLSPSRRAATRLAHVGYVFQFGELLPELTAVENVALPLKLRGVPWDDAERSALDQLEAVGLSERAHDSPELFSGGEVQRVAIARALVSQPALVLADEPTGALDEENSSHVCDLIFSLAARLPATVVVGTHNPDVAARADRIFDLRDGRLRLREAAGALH